MALIGNYSVFNKTPGRFLAGTSQVDRSNYGTSGSNRNKFFTFAKFNAVPQGYLQPYCWVLPQTSGGMATFQYMTAAMSGEGALAAGIALDAALSATITITNAQLDQIINMLADLSASITVTDAQLAAVASMTANLLAAGGSITNAELGAIISMIASLTAAGSLTNGNMFATSEISASISSLTALSPSTLASAVWSQIIDGGYQADEILKILASVSAGKTSIAGSTVVFRSLSDNKDRVVAAMTGSERTTITIDGAS